MTRVIAALAFAAWFDGQTRTLANLLDGVARVLLVAALSPTTDPTERSAR